MGDALRAFEWARTPLGPVSRWPVSLKTAVGICLSSRFPMFVWWGPELINIYNDAYIPVLGNRHPDALGRPARQTWHEIWDIVGPQADAVMQRGEATWNERVRLVMQRKGYTEDTYFTWSYSPIYDQDSRIGGLFCACTEETQRVLAEAQRDRLLERAESERARLSAAFDHAPSLVAVLRGPEHVFEYANGRYVELVGGRPLLGRPVAQALPEIVEQGFIDLLDRVYATGEPFIGTGVAVNLRRGADRPLEERRFDLVYQPMRDAAGAVSGVLAHAVDVTERHRTEARDGFLLALDESVRPLTDPADITATCARLLGEHLAADRCAYADVEDDQDAFDLIGDYNRGVASIVGRYRFSDFGPEVLRLMRAGEPYVVEDVETHQPPPGDLSSYRQTLIRAVICVPLHKAGRCVAAMAVHQAAPRRWTAEEVDLVRRVAARCWESIERARVERTLRSSEERLRAVFEQTEAGIAQVDLQGRFVLVNQRYCQIVGRPAEELVTLRMQDLTHPEDLPQNLMLFERAVRDGTPFVIEKRYVRPDGAAVWVSNSISLMRDREGRSSGVVAASVEITDRRRAEEQLRRNHDTFYHLIQNNPFGIYVVDADFRLRQVSLGSQKVFANVRPLLGRDFAEVLRAIWAEPFATEAIERFRHTLRTGEPYASPTTVKARQDIPAIEAYDWRIERLTLPDGRHGVVCYFYDLSERQRWEAAVREGEERLRLALAIAEMGTFEIDLRTDAVTVNDAGRAIYGWAEGEPLTFTKVQTHFHPDDREDVMRAVGAALRPDGPGEFEVEQRIVRRDGATRWIRVRGRAIFPAPPAAGAAAPVVPDRQPTRCIGTYIDITEQKEAEREREQLLAAERAARADAERASEAKSEFLATLSHELRTPLTPVLLTVSLMESNPALPPELRDDVATIRRNVELESRLISDLLDLTRITRGKLQLDAQEVDLHLIVRSAIDICQREASARLVTDLCAQRHTVRGDSTRLQQVFWNLINNAQKFTPPQGTITVRSSNTRDGQIRVEVADTGAGIDADVLPKLFNAFEQGDVRTLRQQAGLGLGLAISRRLAEAHGGTVHASSGGRGCGATFTVELPVVEMFVPATPAAPQSSSPAVAATPVAHGLNVLLVEDHEPTLRALTRLLRHLGHRVTGVTTAASATAVARQHDDFDVIISDLGLPDGSGLDVMRQLRQRYGDRSIALTGYGMESDIAASRDAGFAEHLTKPVDVAALQAAIGRLTSAPSPTAPPGAWARRESTS